MTYDVNNPTTLERVSGWHAEHAPPPWEQKHKPRTRFECLTEVTAAQARATVAAQRLQEAQAVNREALDDLNAAEEALARVVWCPDCHAAPQQPCRGWGEEPAHVSRRRAARGEDLGW
jgi:hypothetical protein